MKKIFLAFSLLIGFVSICAQAEKFPSAPRLVLVLVYDQFRADLLAREADKFLPSQQKNGQLGGFRYLMEQGAYFPFAEYQVLQSMTCPGHAMILSGSFPYANGVSLNESFDVNKGKGIYCAEDSQHGLSPTRLKGSTVGDETKLNSPGSRVIALALKDRSAIMLGGHAADLALWFDSDEMKWVTSSYYEKRTDLSWLKAWNEKVSVLKDVEMLWKPVLTKNNFLHKAKAQSNEGLGFPYGVELTNKAALEIVKRYKMGQRGVTDILAVSFSTHDISGHKYGPHSPEMEELTLQEDRLLADFLNGLKTSLPGGLNQVLIVLTADHGVAPVAEVAREKGLNAGTINAEETRQKLNEQIAKKFSQKDVFAGVRSFNFYLSKAALNSSKKNDILNFAKDWLMQQAGVAQVVTIDQFKNDHMPPEMIGQQFRRSFVPGVNGELILIPLPFWYEASEKNKTTHMTGYTYDRTVPLIFVGPGIKSGVYAQKAYVVDIAPTLSFMLGQLAPALSEGRALSEAIDSKRRP